MNSSSGILTRSTLLHGSSYEYQIHLPAALAGKDKQPVILFLHGIGQRGVGGYLPTEGAKGAVVQSYLEKVPAMILLPQCRPNRFWSDHEMDSVVMQALHETVTDFQADTARLYVTGVSMGGYGAVHLAYRHAETFAAVISICGGSPLREGERFKTMAKSIGSTPVWLFHGDQDAVVPVSESRQIVQALRDIGSEPRYSEYPGVGHNVWMNALQESELIPWLLSQRREG